MTIMNKQTIILLFFKLKFNYLIGNNLIDDQKSPIFIQFLDCVHQLMHQFPLSFEYNMTFLLEVAVNVYSCLYGNFLYDSYQVKLKNHKT